MFRTEAVNTGFTLLLLATQERCSGFRLRSSVLGLVDLASQQCSRLQQEKRLHAMISSNPKNAVQGLWLRSSVHSLVDLGEPAMFRIAAVNKDKGFTLLLMKTPVLNTELQF